MKPGGGVFCDGPAPSEPAASTKASHDMRRSSRIMIRPGPGRRAGLPSSPNRLEEASGVTSPVSRYGSSGGRGMGVSDRSGGTRRGLRNLFPPVKIKDGEEGGGGAR